MTRPLRGQRGRAVRAARDSPPLIDATGRQRQADLRLRYEDVATLVCVSESGWSPPVTGRIPKAMNGFAGVTTTGNSYCQPSCGAQPLASHVRQFQLAAAAEAAGYRACMRCRPYRVPEPVTWTDPELICRAVSLILDRALDEGTEDELGRRLGVSGRHLRRLFAGHLGVTPDGLALGTGALRAKAARRYRPHDHRDRLCGGFRQPAPVPTVLPGRLQGGAARPASQRRKTDRLVADGGLILRLPFHGAMDWPRMADFLAARRFLVSRSSPAKPTGGRSSWVGIRECLSSCRVATTTCSFGLICPTGRNSSMSSSAPGASPASTRHGRADPPAGGGSLDRAADSSRARDCARPGPGTPSRPAFAPSSRSRSVGRRRTS